MGKWDFTFYIKGDEVIDAYIGNRPMYTTMINDEFIRSNLIELGITPWLLRPAIQLYEIFIKYGEDLMVTEELPSESNNDTSGSPEIITFHFRTKRSFEKWVEKTRKELLKEKKKIIKDIKELANQMKIKIYVDSKHEWAFLGIYERGEVRMEAYFLCGDSGLYIPITVDMEELNIANLKILYERLKKMAECKERTSKTNNKKPQETPDMLFEKGLKLVQQEKYEEALQNFKKVIEINPQHAHAYFYVGYCNFALRNYEEAIKAYEQTLKINPEFPEAYYNLGVIYFNSQDYKQALKFLEKALQLKSEWTEIEYMLGFSFYHLGDYLRSMEYFRKALQKNPDIPEVHYALGQIYFIFGDINAAYQEFKYLKKINSEMADDLYKRLPLIKKLLWQVFERS